MKRIIFAILFFVLLFPILAYAVPPIARLPLASNLEDVHGQLTNVELSRISAATYIDNNGVLQTAYGNRENLIEYSEDVSQTSWWSHTNSSVDSTDGVIADATTNSHGIAKFNGDFPFLGITYTVQLKLKSGGKNYVYVDFATYTSGWSMTSHYAASIYLVDGSYQEAEVNSSGTTTITGPDSNGFYYVVMVFNLDLGVEETNRSFQINAETAHWSPEYLGDGSTIEFFVKDIQVEELPSGNVIGPELFDQDGGAGGDTDKGSFDITDGTEVVLNNDFSSYSGSDPNVNFDNWIEVESTGSADWNYTDSSAELDITSQPTNPWDIQFVQSVTLDANTTYIGSATIKGDSGAPTIEIKVQELGGDYATLGVFSITPDGNYHTYSFAVNSRNFTSSQFVINFQGAGEPQSGDTMWIREVHLQKIGGLLGDPLFDDDAGAASDNHKGQFTTLGQEELENNDFSAYTGSDPNINFDDWTEQENSGGADWNYTDSAAEMDVTSTPTNDYDIKLHQTITVDADSVYMVTANIKADSGAPDHYVIFQETSGWSALGVLHFQSTGSYQEVTGYFWTDTYTSINIGVYFTGVGEPQSGDTMWVREVSVKKVDDLLLAFQIDPPDLSSDIFSKGTGWTYDSTNDEYDCDGSQSSNTNLTKSTGASILNSLWRITFQVNNYSAGQVRVLPGGYNATSWYSANGTFTEYVFASDPSSDTNLYIQGDSDFTGSVKFADFRKVDISWRIYTGNTIDIDEDVGDGGALHVTYGGGANGAFTYLQSSYDLSANTTANKMYFVFFDAMAGSGDTVDVQVTGDNGTTFDTISEINTFSMRSYYLQFVSNGTADHQYLRFSNMGSGEEAWIDNIEVYEVDISWVKYYSNTLEIAPEVWDGALHITYVDYAQGAYLYLRDDQDLSDDLIVGQNYLLSFYAMVGSGDTVSVEVDSGSQIGLTTIDRTTITYYEIPFKTTSALGTFMRIIDMGSGEEIWIDNISLKAIPSLALLEPSDYVATSGSTETIPAQARFEAEGLLLEGSESVNYILASEEFDDSNYWGGQYISVTANQANGPDGNLTADKIVMDGTSDPYIAQYVDTGILTGRDFIFSCWVWTDSGQPTEATLFIYDSPSVGDIATYPITLTTIPTRYEVQNTFSSSTDYQVAVRIDGKNSSPSVGEYYYVWGAQLEESFWASSYIPTTDSPAVRTSEMADGTYGISFTNGAKIKDMLTNTGGDDTDSKVLGTIIVEYTPAYASSEIGISQYLGIITFTTDALNALFNATNASGNPRAAYTYNYTSGSNTTQDWVKGETYTAVARMSSTSPNYVNAAAKITGTWYYGAYNPAAVYPYGNTGYLHYDNPYNGHYKNLRIYDYYIPTDDLESGAFEGKAGSFSLRINIR